MSMGAGKPSFDTEGPNKDAETEYARLQQLHEYERHLWQQGVRLVAGIDEAGRGPLAGPVVAAAVILTEELLLPGLNDSKQVSQHRRPLLANKVKLQVTGWGVGIIPVGVIERDNILQATFQAMRQALQRLPVEPEHLLIDGCCRLPGVVIPQTTVVKGDTQSAAIAAASLIAKTTRDAIMTYYSKVYPHYYFDQNKGYPTPAHLAAIRRYGPCCLHRHTFRGVKEYC